MYKRMSVVVVFCVFTVLVGCAQGPDNKASVPNVVTPDIQAGIEKYIEDQTRMGGCIPEGSDDDCQCTG